MICTMNDALYSTELVVRTSVAAGVFALMALWEWLAPRRPRTAPRAARWPSNLGLVALNTVLLRLLMPTSLVAFASLLEASGWGLLGLMSLPMWLEFLVALVVLDLLIYGQHVLFHRVPWLWRLHRMHHADTDIDVTNGLRFHPLEIVLSMGIKLIAVAVLGAPAMAVLVFEAILNALAVFNHANARLPDGLDRALRPWVVTPDMHRIHHSWLPAEHHRNFGFNLSVWDRWFGTYVAEPSQGQLGMTIGLRDFREPEWRRIDRLLIQPWASPTARPPAPPV